jgi:hypothetical protein
MDWLHIYIAGAAFSVSALVALVLLVSSKQVKIDTDHGPLTYVKFIWANFLKPHDKSVEGQQGALESFYKTQVRPAWNALERWSWQRADTMATRPPSTMLPAVVCSEVARTCSAWSRRN